MEIWDWPLFAFVDLIIFIGMFTVILLLFLLSQSKMFDFICNFYAKIHKKILEPKKFLVIAFLLCYYSSGFLAHPFASLLVATVNFMGVMGLFMLYEAQNQNVLYLIGTWILVLFPLLFWTFFFQ